MRTTITPLEALSRNDLEAWAELAEAAAEPNPFLHPDFVVAAARAMRPRGLRVLHCEDAGGWAVCLPVVPVVVRRDVVGPGLASWRHDYCYLGTPLVAAGRGSEGMRDLLDAVRARRKTGFLALDWVRVGAIDAALADAGASPIVADRFERAFVRRQVGGTPLSQPLSAGRAKKLRRGRRELSRALGADLEVVHRTADARTITDFLALEASGWKGRRGTAMGCRPGHGAFFAAVCEAFARRGALQILSLEAGGRSAAMQCNLRAGGGIFCFKVAYDDELGRHSPGTLLELEALDLLADDEATGWMDSCAAPGAALINRLWPERTALHTLIVPAGGVLATTARPTVPVLRAARRARRRLRDGPSRHVRRPSR